MATTFTFASVADTWPAGTSVGAYPGLSQPSTWNRTSAPAGLVVTSATVAADGTLVFSGLQDGTGYYAAAQVSGNWRVRGFRTDNAVTGGGTGGVAKIAATVATLGTGSYDGQTGVVRVGSWPNEHLETLRWDGATSRWVGEEHVVLTQGDTWAMDLSNRTGTALLDWSEFTSAVPYGKSYAFLTASPNLSSFAGAGTLTVDDTTSPHSAAFTTSGMVQVRDSFVTYTGKTGTTLTGCTLVQGAGGTIPTGVPVLQGYPGGWGVVATPVIFAGDLYAAGLHLEERLICLMNSAFGEKKLTVAPYWTQTDQGDGVARLPIPAAGGMGVSASLTSLASTGGSDQTLEKSFYRTVNNWSSWPLATPTKRFLTPTLIGKMEAAATTSGSVLDSKLVVRWAS